MLIFISWQYNTFFKNKKNLFIFFNNNQIKKYSNSYYFNVPYELNLDIEININQKTHVLECK